MSHPVSDKLIAWYQKHKRALPWRDINDPYKIWLSEIILQQTQVAQGLSYYQKFIEIFPNVNLLAKAKEDKVLQLWQGLGYYSRARNLHAAAKTVSKEYKGQFPKTYDDIKNLKGVGDYTAAAIASFAYNLPYAVVDGNVYRVYARVFDIAIPINSTEGKKQFQLLANELLNAKKPALHNSAVMEFGALHCKPQNPKCETCPIQEHCLAFKNDTISLRPVKQKKIKIKHRYLHYFVLNYKNKVYVQKRTQKDIWQNLYEFFLIETQAPTPSNLLLEHTALLQLTSQFKVQSIQVAAKHVLSHQHLHATFYELNLDNPIKNNTALKAVNRSELINMAIPQLIKKYLK